MLDKSLIKAALARRDSEVKNLYAAIYSDVRANMSEGKTHWQFKRTNRSRPPHVTYRRLMNPQYHPTGSAVITDLVITKLKALGLEVEIDATHFTVGWDRV